MSDTATTVNVVEDFAASDDFTKKHAPFITLEPHGERTMVTVEVGHEVPHPNGPDHYITMIELFVGDAPIAHLDLRPTVTEPRLCIPVDLPAGTVLRALEHCNLHGLWSYEVTL